MPRICCVPGCRTNCFRKPGDKTPHTNTFVFPKDNERREMWLSLINAAWGGVFVPKAYSCVCIKHFRDEFIMRESSAVRDDGTILTLPRSRPKLTKDAYPSIFFTETTSLNGKPWRKYARVKDDSDSLDESQKSPSKKIRRKKIIKFSEDDVSTSDDLSEEEIELMSEGEPPYYSEEEIVLSEDHVENSTPTVKRKLEHIAHELEDDLEEFEDRNDEASSLGAFVASLLKNLKSSQRRKKLKSSIIQLLIDISEEDCKNDSSNN